MTRRAAAAVTTLATAALLGCLATAAPALAADHPGHAAPLTAELKYRAASWTSEGTDMTMEAPRGWALVLTPEGQARFNDPARPDVLTMADREDGSLRQQLRTQVAALQGTPGLNILVDRVHGRGDAVSGELRYRWTPQGGGVRFVDYHYRGDDTYEVAGRMIDQKGLMAVLVTAASTGDCS